MAADQKVRWEQWDFLAEEAMTNLPAGFNPDHPWFWVIKASTYGMQSQLADWWSATVTDPLLFSGSRPTSAVADFEGTRAPPPPAPFGCRVRDNVKDKTKTNKASGDVCWAWNRAANGCRRVCTHKRKHVCEFCGSNKHRGIACPKAPQEVAPRKEKEGRAKRDRTRKA